MHPDLASTHVAVVVLGALTGALFGAVAQRSNFCTMGAIADVVNFGDWTRARQVLCAIAVAIIGVALLRHLETVDIGRSFYVQPRLIWLSHVVGGLAFGFGMTLGSGCGSKALVRIGGGSLRALVTLLVLGLFAWFTLRGILAVWRVAYFDSVHVMLPRPQDLPSLAGLSGATALVAALAIGVALLVFVFAGREFRRQPWSIASGLIVGLAVVAGWYVTGRIGFVAEHPETLEPAWIATNSGRPESLTFTAPPAYLMELLAFWSDRSRVMTFGIATILGAIAGAAAMALATRTFRWEGFASTEDLANHLVGGALMGFGGVLALGCTVGQGLTGLSTLSLGSLLTVVAIVLGCRLGLAWQLWRIERSGS
ncbi:MAG: YeeE/YedE family protein [Casimicrobiaceae bacterium]|nr:YeeE/YedE family protein [Casimicrobiaceae bacterium]MCX8099197.1 YeeE/YedE family protein [Casimicrobiaceae bacterium]MDW8311429.1 YeeE/YedE family protein [Burkholderiales bacterium]